MYSISNSSNSSIFLSPKLEKEVIESIQDHSQEIYEKIEAYLFMSIVPDFEKFIYENPESKKELLNICLYTALKNTKIKGGFILVCGLMEILMNELKQQMNSNNCHFFNTSIEKRDDFEYFLEVHKPLFKSIHEFFNNKELVKIKILELFYDEETPRHFIRGVLKGIQFIDKIKEKSFDYYLSFSNQEEINNYALILERHVNFFERIFSDWIEYCTNMLYSKNYRKHTCFK